MQNVTSLERHRPPKKIINVQIIFNLNNKRFAQNTYDSSRFHHIGQLEPHEITARFCEALTGHSAARCRLYSNPLASLPP